MDDGHSSHCEELITPTSETPKEGPAVDIRNPPPLSRLLALPAELRNEIWTHVLGGVIIHIPNKHQPRIRSPALLYTCRQIRFETLPIFFAHSIFDGQHAAMLRFFGLIGRENVELIRHVGHSEHVGLNTLQAVRLTLGILGGAYESWGLRSGALHLRVLIEGEGEAGSWINLPEAMRVETVRMGQGLSGMPLVRRADSG